MARSLRNDRGLTGSGEALQPEPDAPLALGLVGSGRAARALVRTLARRGNRMLIARHGDSAARLAEDLGAELLPAEQALATADVTAVVCGDDLLAYGFIAAATESNISRPGTYRSLASTILYIPR